MQRLLMTRRNMLFSLAGMLVTALLAIYGCSGGSGSYSTLDSQVTTTKTASPIITATTLKAWIDEGKLNAPFGSKDRIVIVSPSSLADWINPAKGHIPNAVRWDTSEFAEDGRIEGIFTSGSMMPSGEMMDRIIKRLGIDGNTTVVISLPKNSLLYYQTLIYWDLRYWGFPKERIKILNGGDDAWEVDVSTLTSDATEKHAPSTYSVAYNSGLKTSVRYSVGQMIAKIDEMNADSTLSNAWQIIDVRGFYSTKSVSTDPSNNREFYLKNALRLSSYTQFFTKRVNNETTRNLLFPTKDELVDLFKTSKIYNPSDVYGTPTGNVSESKKTIVTCAASSSASPSFALFDAVLGVPDGQITMYDGSSSQWTYYSYALIKSKYSTATDAQIYAWAFDNPSNMRSVMDSRGGVFFPAAFPTTGFIPALAAPSLVNGPGVAGTTDQIERGNQAYIEFIRTNTPAETNSGSGGSQQGC